MLIPKDSVGKKEQPLSDSGVPPGELAIATPNSPSFEIITAKIHQCDGDNFVVTEVKNIGAYYFQWAYSTVNEGVPYSSTQYWEDPWIFSGDSVCPVPTSGEDSFGPGATAHIYRKISSNIVENYHIQIGMCTYAGIPNDCIWDNYILEDSIGILKPHLEVTELVLCWVGPGPLYEVVNSIPEGSSVELLGVGDVEGYLVVQEPKYQRACWLMSEGAEEVPDSISGELTTFQTPILTGGVINGRIFKDQDGNGAFGGADVGFPGAQVSLAPGSCSNPGAAKTTRTNSEGWYSFGDVDPGNYCLFAAKPTTCQGFSTADSENISVKWESFFEKNFGLESCR